MQPQMPQPYDFITSQQTPQKGMFSGQSTRARILIFSVVIVILLILGSITFAILSSGNDKSTPDIISVAQQQTEITRIAAIGLKQSRSAAAQNLAITTQLAMESDQAKVLARLSASHKKPDSKTLAAKQNSATDAALTQADQSNTFDEAFTKTIQTELIAYQKSVKTAYDETTGPKTKQTLSDCYIHAGTILSGISAGSDTTQTQ